MGLTPFYVSTSMSYLFVKIHINSKKIIVNDECKIVLNTSLLQISEVVIMQINLQPT